MNPNRLIVRIAGTLAGLCTCIIAIAAEPGKDVVPTIANPVFAIVNGVTITQKDFHAAYGNYLRQKYYHREVPEGQLQEARKTVADILVDRVLLLEEAKRRGVVANDALVDQNIAEYEQRYAQSAMWQQRREALLPGLRQQLAETQVLEQMDKIGRAFSEPSEEDVRTYYSTRQELFVEPEKMRLHTILLKVDPSSPKAKWDAAREEAAKIVERLKGGADFDELARLHSNDVSAENGGNMGYIHRGMIPEQVQTEIDKYAVGNVIPPIDVLEGIAIFRLDERIPAKHVGFDEVSGRARELYRREASQKAWEAFIAGLRARAQVQIIEPEPNAAVPATTAAPSAPQDVR